MPDPITLSQVLQIASLAQRITSLFGLMEFVDAKVDKLLHADFGAAYRQLEAARNSNSEAEQVHQLRDARTTFQHAVEKEDGSRKALALLGLACCQQWLGEKANCTNNLNEILQINPKTFANRVKGVAKFGLIAATGVLVPTILGGKDIGVDPAYLNDDVLRTIAIQKVVAQYLGKPVPK